MTYTGDVTPGGPSDVRELPDLTIRKMSVSPMHNNVYLLTCRATGDQLLIDAADDPQRCLALVAEGTGSLHHLVTTHRHWDHTRALTDVAEATGAVTYAGDLDAEGLPVAPTVRLVDGDRISLGDLSLDVAIVSGHTAASVVLAHRDPTGHAHVFTGDTLFPGGPGATHFEGGDFPTIIRSIEDRLFSPLAADTLVLPGHGDRTTIGTESPHLQEWVDRGW